MKIQSLFTFDNNLFAATFNNMTGLEVMRSPDGEYWTQVNPDGFGDSNTFTTLWSNGSIVFKKHIYIGIWNNANGGEIWKYLGFPLYLPLVTR